MPLFLVANPLAVGWNKGRQQIKGDVRGLEVLGVGMRDVVRHRAEGGVTRRCTRRFAAKDARDVDAGELSLDDVALGDSIALNGACMTVTSKAAQSFTVDVSRESLDCTTGLGARAWIAPPDWARRVKSIWKKP